MKKKHRKLLAKLQELAAERALERDGFKDRAWAAEKALKAAGLPYRSALMGKDFPRDWEFEETFSNFSRAVSGLIGPLTGLSFRRARLKPSVEKRPGDVVFVDDIEQDAALSPEEKSRRIGQARAWIASGKLHIGFDPASSGSEQTAAPRAGSSPAPPDEDAGPGPALQGEEPPREPDNPTWFEEGGTQCRDCGGEIDADCICAENDCEVDEE